MTPDPYSGSGKPRVPQSWNRYAYVYGDPVNANDRSGLTPYYDIPAPVDSGDEFDYIGDGFQDTSGYCDPSTGPGYCGGPCVNADGLPSPSPFCQYPVPTTPTTPSPSLLAVPTSLEVLGIVMIPCNDSLGGPVGLDIGITYQVLNQFGAPFDQAGLVPQENLTGSTINYGAASTPFNYVALGPPTNAMGQFVDPFGDCATVTGPGTLTMTDSVKQSIILGSGYSTLWAGLPIRFNNFQLTISAFGLNIITNGTDINIQCQPNETACSTF
jgi:hypothetical protein